MLPLVASLYYCVDILSVLPKQFVKRISYLIIVFPRCLALAIQQNEDIPVGVVPIVAAGTRPEKPQHSTFREYLLRNTFYMFYECVTIHFGDGFHQVFVLFSRCKDTNFFLSDKIMLW